ncbi:MAG TPA: acido-empty-quinoprotein group A, partial [Bryobacteraceae bacterium]|nr:acido-empty-quinoprotein group A [Bryobacteraceae bacterium]
MRFLIFLCLTAATAFAQGGPLDNRLLLKTPAATWPTYHGDSTGRHYSALRQITRENVHALSLAWVSRVSNANQDAIFGGDGPDPKPTPAGTPTPP